MDGFCWAKRAMKVLNRQIIRCCQERFQGVRIKTGHITNQGGWLHFAFPSIDQYWSGRAALSNWWVGSLNKFQPEWRSFCQGIPSLVVKIFHLPFGSMPPCSEMCCPTGSQACFSVGGNLSYVDPVSCLEAYPARFSSEALISVTWRDELALPFAVKQRFCETLL